MPEATILDTDKKEEKYRSPEAVASQDLSAAPAISPEVSVKATEEAASNTRIKIPKTAGWRIHNELTYRGIDWLMNSAIGVTIAFLTERTLRGRKVGNWLDDKSRKAFSPMFKKSAENLENAVVWTRRFLSIMVGGTAIIPPMMFMENKQRKKKIVRWIDEKIYGEEVIANDPKFAEAYARIDNEPKKGFLIGFASRILALIPIYAAVIHKPTNKFLTKNWYDRLGGLTKWTSDKVGIKAEKMHNTHFPEPDGTNLSNWDFMHRMIGFDFGLTIFYAVLHEIAYKTLAALGIKNGTHAKNSSFIDNVLHTDLITDPEELQTTSDIQKNWTDREKSGRNKPAAPAASFQESVLQPQADTSVSL